MTGNQGSGIGDQGSGKTARQRRAQRQTIVLGAGLIAFAGALAWVLFVWLPRLAEPQPATPPSSTAATGDAPAENVRKIKARVFYVSADGTRLTSVEREVAYASDTVSQAREILRAQLEPVSEPLVSAIPAGTALRAMFVIGDHAFVDLGGPIASEHPGGAVGEQLTVYAIVHALTLNLPAIKAVQLLIEGREVETLAGHIDLRRPLPQNTDLTVAN
jgi:spore germination protein GerM